VVGVVVVVVGVVVAVVALVAVVVVVVVGGFLLLLLQFWRPFPPVLFPGALPLASAGVGGLQTHGFYTESSPHRTFYAQHFFTYRRFHTQIPIHGRRIAHRNLCTQHTFTRNQFLHREVLFPLLDHLPFVLANIWNMILTSTYLHEGSKLPPPLGNALMERVL